MYIFQQSQHIQVPQINNLKNRTEPEFYTAFLSHCTFQPLAKFVELHTG